MYSRLLGKAYNQTNRCEQTAWHQCHYNEAQSCVNDCEWTHSSFAMRNKEDYFFSAALAVCTVTGMVWTFGITGSQ